MTRLRILKTQCNEHTGANRWDWLWFKWVQSLCDHDLYWVINDFLHVFNSCTSSGELKDLLGNQKNLLKDVCDNDREEEKSRSYPYRIHSSTDRIFVAMLECGRTVTSAEGRPWSNLQSIEMIKIAFRLSFPSLLPRTSAKPKRCQVDNKAHCIITSFFES